MLGRLAGSKRQVKPPDLMDADHCIQVQEKLSCILIFHCFLLPFFSLYTPIDDGWSPHIINKMSKEKLKVFKFPCLTIDGI